MPLLEQRIKEKIQEARESTHPAQNRIYIESLRIEIETLNCVLKEIVSLSQNDVSYSILLLLDVATSFENDLTEIFSVQYSGTFIFRFLGIFNKCYRVW